MENTKTKVLDDDTQSNCGKLKNGDKYVSEEWYNKSAFIRKQFVDLPVFGRKIISSHLRVAVPAE